MRAIAFPRLHPRPPNPPISWRRRRRSDPPLIPPTPFTLPPPPGRPALVLTQIDRGVVLIPISREGFLRLGDCLVQDLGFRV